MTGLTAELLLRFTSSVILGSEPHGTHGHILLFDGSQSLQIVLSFRVPWDSWPKFVVPLIHLSSWCSLYNLGKDRKEITMPSVVASVSVAMKRCLLHCYLELATFIQSTMLTLVIIPYFSILTAACQCRVVVHIAHLKPGLYFIYRS
jgi:hypothetical protein